MSVAAQLPRPGVEVIQEFRSVSPTVVTPTLVPCVVGVAKQLVEVTIQDASGNTVLNTDALIVLPAFFISSEALGGPPKVYTGLDGLTLSVVVNNAAAVPLLFSDPTAAGLTPNTVVSQINTALLAAGVSSVIAETIETGEDTWQLRTVGVGEFQTILIDAATSPAVLTSFGIGVGKTYQGLTQYNQLQIDIPLVAFPDPNNNLSELAVEFDSIRVFLATEGGGSGLAELNRDEAFLRNGVVDDAAVTAEGSGDITTGATLVAETLVLRVNGSTVDITVTFASPANTAAVLADINTNVDIIAAGVTATAGVVPGVILTTTLTGAGASIEIRAASTSLVLLGFTADTDGLPGSFDGGVGKSIEAIDDGNGDVVTPIIDFDGQDFDASPTAGELLASAAFVGPLILGSTLIISDGQQAQTIVFTAAAAIAAVVTEIDAVMGAAAGGKILATDSGGSLSLVPTDVGSDAVIRILGGTALGLLDPGGTPEIFAGAELSATSPDALGIPYTTSTAPIAHKPLPGDELYIDGEFFANITQVAVGGVVDRLKIDRQITIDDDIGRDFFIQAKNLVAGGTPSRPYPDLEVDLQGNVQMKHQFLRNVEGNPDDVVAPIFLAYTAVRQDVTALAASPGLLRFDDTATLGDSLGPLNTDNPLGLGLFFALLNAPGAQVTGLGVDAISADAPFGTVEAFTRAAEYLEGFEVYAIAILTHDQTVAQVYNTHVSFKSQPEEKGERIVLWNPDVPTRALDAIVASGTDGDGLTTLTLDTKVASLGALLNNAGVSPVGTIPTTAGAYLDLASDDNRYSIMSVSGSVVTLRTSFAAGDNDDGFYSTDPLTLPVISQTFSVLVRGAELLTPTGQQDRQAVAENMALLGQSFLNRRFWLTFPDTAAALLDGLEQSIDGFYMNAAIAGMIGQQPPQQSFTNFPMSGFSRVIGSNDQFSETHMNIMAGGGVYIIVQDGQGAPLIARFALTTDLTSIETRTDSITKVVDFTAKFLRRSLQSFIGRFNITQGFLDSLGSVISGVLGFLVESGVLIGGTLNNIIQDEDAPDTVLIDISLDVPFPANFIRLTLVV
jgi:hypothetical protein